jgi:hypothetical protein
VGTEHRDPDVPNPAVMTMARVAADYPHAVRPCQHWRERRGKSQMISIIAGIRAASAELHPSRASRNKRTIGLIEPLLWRPIAFGELQKPRVGHALGSLAALRRAGGFFTRTTDCGGHWKIIDPFRLWVKQKTRRIPWVEPASAATVGGTPLFHLIFHLHLRTDDAHCHVARDL